MYIVMPAAKEERVNIRIDPDLKLDARIAASMRRWTLSQLIIDLLHEHVAAIKTANLEGFKDAAQRLESADTSARPKRTKTRRVAVQHHKGNEDEKLSSRIPNTERRRTASGGRKR